MNIISILKKMYIFGRSAINNYDYNWEYYKFAIKNRKLGCTPPIKPDGRALVVSFLGKFYNATKEEAFLAKALQVYGKECFILLYDKSPSEKYYKLFGINNFIYLAPYLLSYKDILSMEEIEDILKDVKTFDHLLNLKYQDVKVGKYVCSTMMRRMFSGNLDINDKFIYSQIKADINQAISTVYAARDIYNVINPDTTMFLERGYTPFGEFFDLSLQRGLNTIQWNGCHRDDAFVFKRYNLKNKDKHPSSLSAKTWQTIRALPWDDSLRYETEKELYKNYSSGGWFSEVGTQFDTKIIDRNSLLEQLGLDQNKKIAVIFSHIFWDATFFWGEDLFQDYREWFIETIKQAVTNENIQWIVKLHPANNLKMKRSRFSGEMPEISSIKEEIGHLPDHIKILMPTTQINTYSLFSIMDYCLTVRGTIGIEAAFFGIPVLTAGTGRYDGLGFTIDSGTIEEYLEKIKMLHKVPRMNKEQINLAQRFAFGTFILRPFCFDTMKLHYHKERARDKLTVTFDLERGQSIVNNKDLKEFGQWAVNSALDDYLNFDKLNTIYNNAQD